MRFEISLIISSLLATSLAIELKAHAHAHHVHAHAQISAKEGDDFTTSDSIGIPKVDVPDTQNPTQPVMKELLTDPMGDPVWPVYEGHQNPEGGSTDGAPDIAGETMDDPPLFDEEEIESEHGEDFQIQKINQSEHGEDYKKFVDGGNFDLNEGEEQPELPTRVRDTKHDIAVGEPRDDIQDVVVEDIVTADKIQVDGLVSDGNDQGVFDRPLGDAPTEDDGMFDIAVGEEKPEEEGAYQSFSEENQGNFDLGTLRPKVEEVEEEPEVEDEAPTQTLDAAHSSTDGDDNETVAERVYDKPLTDHENHVPGIVISAEVIKGAGSFSFDPNNFLSYDKSIKETPEADTNDSSVADEVYLPAVVQEALFDMKPFDIAPGEPAHEEVTAPEEVAAQDPSLNDLADGEAYEDAAPTSHAAKIDYTRAGDYDIPLVNEQTQNADGEDVSYTYYTYSDEQTQTATDGDVSDTYYTYSNEEGEDAVNILNGETAATDDGTIETLDDPNATPFEKLTYKVNESHVYDLKEGETRDDTKDEEPSPFVIVPPKINFNFPMPAEYLEPYGQVYHETSQIWKDRCFQRQYHVHIEVEAIYDGFKALWTEGGYDGQQKVMEEILEICELSETVYQEVLACMKHRQPLTLRDIDKCIDQSK